jgi:hypothetical protein
MFWSDGVMDGPVLSAINATSLPSFHLKAHPSVNNGPFLKKDVV